MDTVAAGAFIRARREVLQPEDVGLRRTPRRRTAGLRREEVADLAGMSTDYLARLERGSGSQPSEQMINALARALRLTIDERDHLLILAGHHPPARPGSSSHVSPGLMRILDALTDTPAQVMGAIGETLAQNSAAVALFGDETRHAGLRRAAAYRWFTDPVARDLYPMDERDHHSHVLVTQLRRAAANLRPAEITPLLTELHRASAEFTALWAQNDIEFRYSEQKRFRHAEVGELSLYCQTAVDLDHFQTLLVFTATPGTESADKLRLLTVVGSYNIASGGSRATRE